MDTLEYVFAKYKIDRNAHSPIEIPGVVRQDLAALFSELGFRRGAEIGVESGEYSETLCRQIPGVELYSVDAWKAYYGYRDHVNQAKIDGFYQTALARLKPYNCRLLRMFSTEAAKKFKDGQLDFVYIDGNHNFQNATADIAAWSRKVRPGGIVAGHDYVKYGQKNDCHVVQAVNGWADAYGINPWFLVGSAAKVEGVPRDNARSWFWVKK